MNMYPRLRYWRIRYESSIVDAGDYRTIVVYKDSQEVRARACMTVHV